MFKSVDGLEQVDTEALLPIANRKTKIIVTGM